MNINLLLALADAFDNRFENVLTLKELITKLEQFDGTLKVIIKNNSEIIEFDSIGSYRGIYKYLAIGDGYSDEEFIGHGKTFKSNTVADIINLLKECNNNYFTGYKGGDFKMSDNTKMWVSDYGIASELGIVDVVQQDDKIVILTREETE